MPCEAIGAARFAETRLVCETRRWPSRRAARPARAGLRLTSIDGEVRHPAWSRNRNRLTRQWRPGETGMCHRAVSFPDPLHLLGYPLIGFRAEAKSDRLPQKRKRLADQNLLAPNPERW